MLKKISKKERVFLELKSIGLIVSGALIVAFAYALFLVPHKIVAGGILGLSMVIHEQINISIGTIALAVNIPLLLWGTKILGRNSGFKTVIFMVLISFLLDGVSSITKGNVIVQDVLVSSIFGGALIGLSIFIVKRAGATTGGNDIVAQILSKKINLQFHQIMLLSNVIIILLGVITYGDFTIAAYCLITIIATSKTIEYFASKNEKNKTVLIFSNNNSVIRKILSENEQMNDEIIRLIHQDSDDKLLLITKGTKKLAKLEETIYSVDPKAHIIMLDSNANLTR